LLQERLGEGIRLAPDVARGPENGHLHSGEQIGFMTLFRSLPAA
jgi:hypothetical protein